MSTFTAGQLRGAHNHSAKSTIHSPELRVPQVRAPPGEPHLERSTWMPQWCSMVTLAMKGFDRSPHAFSQRPQSPAHTVHSPRWALHSAPLAPDTARGDPQLAPSLPPRSNPFFLSFFLSIFLSFFLSFFLGQTQLRYQATRDVRPSFQPRRGFTPSVPPQREPSEQGPVALDAGTGR
jgi:hypothetical protein